MYREWAPGAAEAQLIGDFNDWQGTAMERDAFGTWTLRLPDGEAPGPAPSPCVGPALPGPASAGQPQAEAEVEAAAICGLDSAWGPAVGPSVGRGAAAAAARVIKEQPVVLCAALGSCQA